MKRLFITGAVVGVVAVAVLAGLLAFGPADFQGTVEDATGIDLGWLPEQLRDDEPQPAAATTTTTTTTEAPPETAAPEVTEAPVTTVENEGVPAIEQACDAAARQLLGEQIAGVDDLNVRSFATPFTVTLMPSSGTVTEGLCFAAQAGDFVSVTETKEGDVATHIDSRSNVHAPGGFEIFLSTENGAPIEVDSRECRDEASCEGAQILYFDAESNEASGDDPFLWARVEISGSGSYTIVPATDDVVLIFPRAGAGQSGLFTYRVGVLSFSEG